MKSLLFVFLFFTGIKFVNAQQVIAVLQHQGTSTIFQNASALSDAHTVAQNGDTIYLSGGYFNTITLSKRLVIVGSGHNPDSTHATGRSYLYSALTINTGSDSSLIEGLYISGDINFQSDAPIHDIIIRRCYFGSLSISGSGTKVNERAIINQNIINGNVDFYDANALVFKNNILMGRIYNATQNILFDHNDILTCIGYNSGNCFTSVSNVIFTNNIIDVSWGSNSGWLAGNNNTFQNNIFNIDPSGWWDNTYSASNININTDTIFTNRTHCAVFDYSQNFHLHSVTCGRNMATDGTDIGIYGGLPVFTFKEGSVPFNPHILSKIIAPTTDSGGNLNINIRVKAQDY